jgi:acetyl-CoA carboxylase biotin carboxyl carrier protein
MTLDNNIGDLEKVQQLIDMMKKNDLVELEIKDGENKILLKRPGQTLAAAVPMHQAVQAPQAHPPASSAAQAPEKQEDDDLIEIKSPIVGTFYSSPSPDSDPFVKMNQHVEEDTVVCIVEAMKVMNEIKAETSGKIVKIMCKAGQAVDYGQVLFKVKPE